jgi:hypothetical protein
MSRLLAGVYLSASGQLGVLELANDRHPDIGILWRTNDPILGKLESYKFHQMLYNFRYEDIDDKRYNFIILNEKDARALLNSWEFLGPLTSPELSAFHLMHLKPGVIWKEIDDRISRYIEILEVGDFFVKIRNIHTGRTTHASRDRFNGLKHNYAPCMIQNKKAILKNKQYKTHPKRKGK